MHREKDEIETDEHQQEIYDAEFFAQKPAAPFRKPVIKRAEQRENRAADQHVMKMRDDEKRIVELQIERHRGEHHARQSAHHENREKSEHEYQRRFQIQTARPERRQPAEN